MPTSRWQGERREVTVDRPARAPSIDELHAAYAGPLLMYALRRVGGDRQAAEEVVQDTLLAAWRRGYDTDRGSLGGWLFTIARNLTIDHHRRRAARPTSVPLHAEAGPPSPPGAVGAAGSDGVVGSGAAPGTAGDLVVSDAEVDRAIEAWQLAQALSELSVEHRDAIVEVHYLGFSVREAAVRLGVPEGTVKSRLYYGLRALRLRLEELGVIG